MLRRTIFWLTVSVLLAGLFFGWLRFSGSFFQSVVVTFVIGGTGIFFLYKIIVANTLPVVFLFYYLELDLEALQENWAEVWSEHKKELLKGLAVTTAVFVLMVGVIRFNRPLRVRTEYLIGSTLQYEAKGLVLEKGKAVSRWACDHFLQAYQTDPYFFDEERLREMQEACSASTDVNIRQFAAELRVKRRP